MQRAFKYYLVKSGHAIDEVNSKAEFILDSIEQVKTVIDD